MFKWSWRGQILLGSTVQQWFQWFSTHEYPLYEEMLRVIWRSRARRSWNAFFEFCGNLLNRDANHVKVVAYHMQNHANGPWNHVQTRNRANTPWTVWMRWHANNPTLCMPASHSNLVRSPKRLHHSSPWRSQCVFVHLQLQSRCSTTLAVCYWHYAPNTNTKQVSYFS